MTKKIMGTGDGLSREIKFRGVSLDTGKRVYGSLFVDKNQTYIVLQMMEYIKRDDYVVYMIEVEASSVGQYTGLKDKNGVEIYEGDVIKYDLDGDGTVRKCVFPFMDTQSRHWLGEMQSLVDDGYYIEVIGNVFEHPHLIEVT